jgi:small subunit ribosomal protein S4e
MGDHQKRLSAPNSWPIERKGQTFTVKAGAGPHGEAGVPLVVLLRDVLKYVDSTKEARYALNEGSVLVNGDPRADHRRPIGMFDILSFTTRGEHYRVFPDEGGRLSLTPISADAADSRLGRIEAKQQVGGGDFQFTLHDGTTLRVAEADAGAYTTKDSLVIDNESKEVVAHFPYEEGALVTAVDGSHAGEIGTIEEIIVTPGSGNNSVRVAQDDGGFETIEPYVVVIDEQFTDGDGDGDGEAADADADADTDTDTDVDAEEASDDEADADGGDDE